MIRFYLTWNNSECKGSVEGFRDDQIWTPENPAGVSCQDMGGTDQIFIKVFDSYAEAKEAAIKLLDKC